MELTITGANAITNPVLHIWDWRVSLYLFLGGLSAGLAVMSSLMHLRKKEDQIPAGETVFMIAPWLVPVILGLGMFSIFLDLERKLNVFWFYLTVQPLSPMSWGSWGLLVFTPLSLLFAYGTLPEQRREWLYRLPFMDDLASWVKPRMQQIALANAAMGVFIGIYTGVLLSAFVARPLWNTAILPMLFLCSALSAGAALMIMLARNQCVKLFFTKIDIGLIIAEMIIIPLFFYGQYVSSESQRLSIMPFFSLSSEYLWYTASLLFIGVVFPLALVMKLAEIKECHEGLSSSDILKMNLSALLVLAGGLVIRLTFVYAGQISKLV